MQTKPTREPERLSNLASTGDFDVPAEIESSPHGVVLASATTFVQSGTPIPFDIIDDSSQPEWHWQLTTIPTKSVWLRGRKCKLLVNDESLADNQIRVSVVSTTKTTNSTNTIQAVAGRLEIPIDRATTNETQFSILVTKNGNGIDVKTQAQASANTISVFMPVLDRGPRSPDAVEYRLGEHYPWKPLTQAKITLQKLSTPPYELGFKVRAHSGTDRLGSILISKIGDEHRVQQSIELAGVSAQQLNEFKQNISLQNDREELQLHWFAVSQNSNAPNHVFNNVPLTIIDQNARESVSAVSFANVIAGTQSIYLSRHPDGHSTIKLNCDIDPAAILACRLFSANTPVSEPQLAAATMEFKNLSLPDGISNVTARFFIGQKEIIPTGTATVVVDVKTGGFVVTNVGPQDFGSTLGKDKIVIAFSRTPHLADPAKKFADAITILHSPSGQFDSQGRFSVETIVSESLDDSDTRKLTLSLPPKPGIYQVRIDGSKLRDAHGNFLEVGGTPKLIHVAELGTGVQLAASTFPVVPGVTRGQAEHIEYPEFLASATTSKGFNPSDKVETRVSRLYFYRDAHRVAQILNRKAQSYNRQEVTVRRQLADKARQEADSRTTIRQEVERSAVAAAQRTRELESQLKDVQRSLQSTLQQLQNASASGQNPQVINQLESAARSFANQASALETQIRSARDSEVAANEKWQQSQRAEDLARVEQFRLETAAAHADPDTFAPGNPKSQDPVARVSISVIGEGLIHLRGPLKGINQVRMMIDQIDAPQGQVRVNVHSTQINGEEAAELEAVANRIQTYIDQARFLTVQSGEMLRKAVVHVAAMRAEEVRGMVAATSQADRDALYLHAFFGRDFIDELRAMDSELLQTGNKLLSLHSMDVTSLSSALMLLALANNSTRLQILDEFERLVRTELPLAEQQYIHNAVAACSVDGCNACRKRICKCHQPPPLCFLAPQSSFTSLRGFFDSQISNEDTMSPLQREVVRLAQILKARLITELEYKQRVMERAVIEERTTAADDSKAQVERERLAQEEVQKAKQALVDARATVFPNIAKATAGTDALQGLNEEATRAIGEAASLLRKLVSELSRTAVPSAVASMPSDNQTDSISQIELDLKAARNLMEAFKANREEKLKDMKRIPGSAQDANPLSLYSEVTPIGLPYKLFAPDEMSIHATDGASQRPDDKIVLYATPEGRDTVMRTLDTIALSLERLRKPLSEFRKEDSESIATIDRFRGGVKQVYELQRQLPAVSDSKPWVPVATISQIYDAIDDALILLQRNQAFETYRKELQEARSALLQGLARLDVDAGRERNLLAEATQLLRLNQRFQSLALGFYQSDQPSEAKSRALQSFAAVDASLDSLVQSLSQLEAKQSIAYDARRPIDHKKFLDMLIDDLEEKYIELLEGTRAHTSNIDNYLKRITTALDDDYNTQYYYPAFRMVRQGSQARQVEFGQTETTNVLCNNRELGKVSPSATMEFDLPRRDILIKEGIDSALAIYNDVGALVNDPNLLALAKMQSGSSPATAAAGTLAGHGAVRNVLPGLRSDTAEMLLAQNAGSGPELESNVEKLIPDPAIYKFETGTGFEIRPVIAPDGQAVVFNFHYLYTTQIREPVRADEKHLGRVKQHLIDTDVQLSNFELREVSRYVVALKAARTAKGVPLLQDIPVIGGLWRPLPSAEKSLQQNIIMAQATIFPTLFDLMGLRWAPAVADLDPLRLSNREYIVRTRHQYLENRIYDYSSARVDDFLRIPEDVRRADLYRSQETLPIVHPNGYYGPGLDYKSGTMREGYDPGSAYPRSGYAPGHSSDGRTDIHRRDSSALPYSDDGRNRFQPGSLMIEEVPDVHFPVGNGEEIQALRIDSKAGKASSEKPVSFDDGWSYSTRGGQ